MQFTQNYSDKIERIREALSSADAVLIGAGSGLSAAAGLTYGGQRFMKYFADFHKKYGITDMYSGGFFPFECPEEYWAWWSRHIWYNRYAAETNGTYENLLSFIKDKNYFVLTTNVDHCFQNAGFSKTRLFYTQGDYGLFQCSKPCHKSTYGNREVVKQMVESQSGMRVPSDLVPCCPVCGRPVTVNLRCDDTFVEDDGWHAACDRYSFFVKNYGKKKIVLLELGVGMNTPVIIKYPFWQMAYKNKKATYICINNGEAVCPQEIEKQSVCINADINRVLQNLM